MIASLYGEIISVSEDSLVLAVAGVGFQIYVPTGLLAQARGGERLFLHTSLIVRQDALTLYGFEKEDERAFFNLLLGVNGVGPRSALSVISTLSVDAIRRAILSETPEIFARVPGIGKKTAQKILLHLQGKVPGTLEGLQGISGLVDVDAEVLEALTGLGYSVVEAQSALQSIPRDAAKDVEERLRLALQYFSG